MPERICSIDGCERDVLARGWCRMHYHRWRIHGDPNAVQPRGGNVLRDLANAEEDRTGLRVCKTCKEVRSLGDFRADDRHRNGRLPNCPPCHKRLTAERYQRQKERDTENRRAGKWREWYLRSKYGIGQAEYDAMLAAQEGKCAACRRETELVIDHCHNSGGLRALLCQDCNLALGHVRDDPAVLRALIDYLECHRAS